MIGSDCIDVGNTRKHCRLNMTIRFKAFRYQSISVHLKLQRTLVWQGNGVELNEQLLKSNKAIKNRQITP